MMTFDEAVQHVLLRRDETIEDKIRRQHAFKHEVENNEILLAILRDMIESSGYRIEEGVITLTLNAVSIGLAIGIAMERQEILV